MKYILLLIMTVSISFASIGKITALNGTAYAVRGDKKIMLYKGSDIEKKDQIKTMDHTKLQIVFNDHTVISLGQKTDFKIEDYIFSKSKVKASFAVSKGIFKSITGRIGKIDHSKFKLKTKNATIGVRGTTFIGVINDDKETIACTSGEIVVENDFGAVAVKAGEITSFRAFQAPSPAKAYNNNFVDQVQDINPQINSDNIVIDTPEVQTDIPVDIQSSVKDDVTDISSSVNVAVDSPTDVVQNIDDNVLPTISNGVDTVTNIVENIEPVESVDVISDTQDSVTVMKDDVTDISSSVNIAVDSPTDVVQNIDDNVLPTVSDGVDTVTNVLADKVDLPFTMTSDDDDDLTDSDFAQQDMEDEEANLSPELVADLEELKDKVGGVTQLHYEGSVNGADVLADNNKISLDFDLGKATVNGNVEFTTSSTDMFSNETKTNWNTDLAGGFTGDNKFTLEAVSDGYSGTGSVELVGEHLEQAVGGIALSQGVLMNKKDVEVSFTADRK